MAKVSIKGKAAVITSTLKLEDIKTVAKYRPDGLKIKDEDGNEVFSIATGTVGAISKFGVTFDGETRNEQKLATVTLFVDEADTDVKELIADKFGSALINLGKLEASVPAVLQAIATEKAQLMESISVE